MQISLLKKNPKNQEIIDIEEIYNIWQLINYKYDVVHSIHLFKNFVYDRELDVALTDNLDNLQNHVNQLVDEATKFKIKHTRRPPRDVKTSMTIEEFTDQYIYRAFYGDFEENCFRLNRAVRSSTTNDRLRSVFRQLLKKRLDNFNDFLELGKLKGWLEPDPTYKMAKPTRQEELNVAEAFHLWDHINMRYDQIELTTYFYDSAHDADLRAILKLGLASLSKQAADLEAKMTHFEVPMPQRPPENFKTPIDPETLEDEFIFRTILRGLQEAMDLHLRAVVESTRNDSLRRFFHGFLETEMEIFDKYLKYGKMKGWVHTPPANIMPS